MKKITSLLVVCALVATTVGVGTIITVSAQETPMTSEQIEQIRSNCVSTKNTLNRLHASDALLRVNMGQIFEAISTKLMDGFNGRVANNNLDVSGLVSASSAFGTNLDMFRNDYISYEAQLSSAISVDCLKQPVSFYDMVAAARIKRTKVHDDIVNLNKYIDAYSGAVNKLEEQYFGIEVSQ